MLCLLMVYFAVGAPLNQVPKRGHNASQPQLALLEATGCSPGPVSGPWASACSKDKTKEDCKAAGCAWGGSLVEEESKEPGHCAVDCDADQEGKCDQEAEDTVGDDVAKLAAFNNCVDRVCCVEPTPSNKNCGSQYCSRDEEVNCSTKADQADAAGHDANDVYDDCLSNCCHPGGELVEANAAKVSGFISQLPPEDGGVAASGSTTDSDSSTDSGCKVGDDYTWHPRYQNSCKNYDAVKCKQMSPYCKYEGTEEVELCGGECEEGKQFCSGDDCVPCDSGSFVDEETGRVLDKKQEAHQKCDDESGDADALTACKCNLLLGLGTYGLSDVQACKDNKCFSSSSLVEEESKEPALLVEEESKEPEKPWCTCKDTWIRAKKFEEKGCPQGGWCELNEGANTGCKRQSGGTKEDDIWSYCGEDVVVKSGTSASTTDSDSSTVACPSDRQRFDGTAGCCPEGEVASADGCIVVAPPPPGPPPP